MSRHRRVGSGSSFTSNTNNNNNNNNEQQETERLFERAVSASHSRHNNRNSNTNNPYSSQQQQTAAASLHDLELMQASESILNASVVERPSDATSTGAMSFAEDSEVSHPARRSTPSTSTLVATLTSSTNLRYGNFGNDNDGDDDDAEDDDSDDDDNEQGKRKSRTNRRKSATADAIAALENRTGGGTLNLMDTSGVSHNSATSAYSEYSEYEEDEFDPEWHARQNQQAARALLSVGTSSSTIGSLQSQQGGSGHHGGRQRGIAATGGPTGTEVTRSISDMESIATTDTASSQLFANRRDLREEVDQTVNLMDVSTGNYDAPGEYGEFNDGSNTNPHHRGSGGGGGRRSRRDRGRGGGGGNNNNDNRGRDSITANFLAAAQNSLVDIFLDSSAHNDNKLPSFRRSLTGQSRHSNGSVGTGGGPGGGNASGRLNQAPIPGSIGGGGGGSHQRRLFYGHVNSGTPPTIREIHGGYYNCTSCLLDSLSLENCCKFVIILFVLVFVIILALPQGTWWIQEELGLINDTGDPILPTPSLNISMPELESVLISEESVRLAALHKIILGHKVTSKKDLLNKKTPQYRASKWLAEEDPANLTLVLSEEGGWGVVDPHTILNRYAMATFYIGMDGPKHDKKDKTKIIWNETRWHHNDHWMSEKHICEWYGIECEGEDHIEHFNLTTNWLFGTIPSELSVLTDLILVDLSNNHISGPFPEFIGDYWLNLEYLHLFKSNFEQGATLPPAIGNLTHLQELVLPHTNLGGSLPDSMNELTQLRVLKLDHNIITGTLPPLGNLAPSLQILNLFENSLTGILPPSLFQLTNLVELSLDHNELKGSILEEIGGFHKLEAFSVSNNKLTGLLPNVWDQIPKLVDFRLDNNNIRGPIPPSLGALTDLEYLTLENNPVTGTIPTELGNLESLVVFQAYYTQLVGSMPKEVCSLHQRRGIDLIIFSDCEDGRSSCMCCDRCF